MKVKVSEATNLQLDWMVSLITNPEWTDEDRYYNTTEYVDCGDEDDGPYSPTTNWPQGGPIIEREKIALFPWRGDGDWQAQLPDVANGFGPTPLIAAMRCYVVSRLGETVEVPDDLP